jgi:NAD(P)H dehydrogenase (quinone)
MAKVLVLYYSAYGHGSRQPSENELEGARFQGRHVAEIAARLGRGAGERGPAPKSMQNPTETTGGTAGRNR